jgi:hypothetical protein
MTKLMVRMLRIVAVFWIAEYKRNTQSLAGPELWRCCGYTPIGRTFFNESKGGIKMDAQSIFEKAMKLEAGADFYLVCTTKAGRNNLVSDLRQWRRSLSKNCPVMKAEQIIIERIESKDGIYGIKISKINPLSIVGYIKNPGRPLERVDLGCDADSDLISKLSDLQKK